MDNIISSYVEKEEDLEWFLFTNQTWSEIKNCKELFHRHLNNACVAHKDINSKKSIMIPKDQVLKYKKCNYCAFDNNIFILKKINTITIKIDEILKQSNK